MLRAAAAAPRVAAAATRAPAVARRSMARSMATYFTKDHEYANVTGAVATCGITDFAQSQLGDVVYVSLPEIGTVVKKGQSMASVESVKAASDVYAPVSGKVVASNGSLSENPALVNSSAEGDAWFVKIEVADATETSALMTGDAYKAHVEASKH